MHTLWFLLLLAVFPVFRCHAIKAHIKHKMAHDHCFSEQELTDPSKKVVEHFVGHKMDWERYTSVQLVKELENAEKRRKRRKRTAETACPNFETISKGHRMSDRSISPWSYRIDVDENRYPSKLAFAQCLCNHCISTSTGKETSSLNSAIIHQNMLVLRKEICPRDESKFTFRIAYLQVPVACTCAVPLYG